MNVSNLFIVSAASVMLLCSGCGGGSFAPNLSGPGLESLEPAYISGNMNSHLKYKPAEVAKATEKAFKTLGISMVSSKVLAVSSESIGKTSNDVKVSVNAEGEEGGSKITIRFGAFGDETQSQKILDEIKKNLSEAAKK